MRHSTNPFADLGDSDHPDDSQPKSKVRPSRPRAGRGISLAIVASLGALLLAGLLLAVVALWGRGGTKGKEPEGTVETARMPQKTTSTKEKGATKPSQAAEELGKHQIDDKADQQKLDAVNIEWFNHFLATFKRAGQPGYRVSREDSRTVYGIMIRQEAILKNHPDWPMLGLNPSPAVERLCTEMKQVTFAPWDHLKKPGLVQTAAQYKTKYIDGQAPDPVDQRLLDNVNKNWFRLAFFSWNNLKSIPGWKAPRTFHQEMYEVLRQRDEILRRHPWWSALGPDYSDEIGRLYDELERTTKAFPDLIEPGKYADLAPSYKARNLDGTK